MKNRFWAWLILLFLVATGWFAVFIPWNGFIDPDAFYHARAAMLFWQHGPLMAFPWLDLTLLGSHFADLHFLFHAISAPFVAWLGMMDGMRVVTILLSAMFVAVFAVCVRWIGLRWPLLWATSLLLSSGLDIRITLGKATPLALTWFIIGLAATWKRRPWIVALATAGFALSHGGWPYLSGSIVLLCFGDILFHRVVLSTTWRDALRSSSWRSVMATAAGAAIGLAIHPNRASIIPMAWTQIVTIGLGTPFQHVTLGQEWLPSDFGTLFVACAPLVIIMMLALLGLLYARRSTADHQAMRVTISSAIITAAFFALTIKSRRNVEYLIPIMTVWCASLWSFIELPTLLALRNSFRGLLRFVAPAALLACFAATLTKEVYTYWIAYHPAGHRDAEFSETMHDIAKRAQPGDRVFHTSWDEFPMLFAQNDQLKYIAGLDPTFLYVATSTFSDAYRDATIVTTSTTKSDLAQLIEASHSRFIFASTKNHARFVSLVRNDPRYELISQHQDSVAFEVKQP